MRAFNHLPLALAGIIALSLTGTALAQDHGHNDAAPVTSAAAASAGLPLVDAEVRRVDSRNNKLSLRHQHIPNLDMPPMTMVFDVADPAVLEGLQNGDRIRVTVEQVDGKYTVMSVQR